MLDGIYALGAKALGISPDSPASHRKFAEKNDLKIKWLSDPDHKVTDAFGIWTVKKIYGREGFGVVRSAFLIDPQGHIADIWRSVKVKGHVETVVNELKSLKHQPI